MVESGKFINKHGVAILLNRRWTKSDQLGTMLMRTRGRIVDLGQ